MTLTLPTPDAGDTARHRFALELLLQQPVPGPEELLASRNLLSDALPEVNPDQWRVLQAMPIAIGDDHLDIAIISDAILASRGAWCRRASCSAMH